MSARAPKWWQAPDRKRGEGEDRLIMLYAFSQMRRMTADEALRFAIEGELMDYLSAQLALNHLINSDMIAGEDSYALTEGGQDALAALNGELLFSERQTIDRITSQYAASFSRDRHVFTGFDKDASGEYVVNLSVREAGMTVFEVRVSVPEKAQARAMCKAFPDHASELYYELIYALTAKED